MSRPVILLCALLLLLSGCSSGAGTRSNVVIVMNADNPDSVIVANYYAQKRGIPSTNICKIHCSSDELITDEAFKKTIRDPIRKFVTGKGKDSIDYIVLTRGIPIRTRDGHWGTDSALTCLFMDDDIQMNNPYFREKRPFTSQRYGMYLVTRLDGLTLADAKALVDRSLAAKPAKGLFLLDLDPAYDSQPGYKPVNDNMRLAAEMLKSRGYEVELPDTKEFVVRAGLMGYYSWGAHDQGYTDGRYRGLAFLPGSIAETAFSTSAFTLTSNRTLQGKRSYITDLVAQGVTGVKGYVYEPYVVALAEADTMFERYTSGRNLAESFYAASRYVHWRDIVLGDPLCAPYAQKDTK